MIISAAILKDSKILVLCQEQGWIVLRRGPLKNKDGYLKSDNQSKTEILNEQFHSVYTQEDMDNFLDFGPNPYFSLDSISTNQKGVHTLLKGIKTHKATWPGEIPSYVFKAAADDLAPLLTRPFQQSLHQGVVPRGWRDATVVPVYKKGKNT